MGARSDAPDDRGQGRTGLASEARRMLRAVGVRRVYRSDITSLQTRLERRVITARHSRRGAGAALRDRILCYHAVGTPSWGVNDVSPRRFARHIQLATAAGFAFTSAADIAVGDAGHDGKPRLAVTFDDGVRSVRTGAWPLLASLSIPCTVFVVTDWVDEKRELLLGWDDLAELADEGMAVASHSCSHPNFAELTERKADAELSSSRATILSRIGVDTREFAVPFGLSVHWDGRLSARAHAAGYDTVYAQSEWRRPAGTVARTFVTRYDDDRTFMAALQGAFDDWEEPH